MSFYTFENIKTGEQFVEEMRMAELDEYLAKRPDIIQVLVVMNLVDPIGIGVTKPPADFQKGILGKIKELPGVDKSSIERRWQIAKEI
jgi:hypothetical protein